VREFVSVEYRVVVEGRFYGWTSDYLEAKRVLEFHRELGGSPHLETRKATTTFSEWEIVSVRE
jgi:hypothetical protein